MALLNNWNFRLFAPLGVLAVMAGLIVGNNANLRPAQPKTVSQDVLLSAPLTFRSPEIQRFFEQKSSPLAAYTETVGGQDLSASDLFWIASQGENFGLSPRALLTTFYLDQGGLVWPHTGGLLDYLQAMAGKLAALEAEGSSLLVHDLPGQPPADRAKDLAETNTAQYALDHFYSAGAKSLSDGQGSVSAWVAAYQDLFAESASAKAVEPPPSTAPFLRLPFDQPKDSFVRVESFFDHYTPGNFTEPTIYRFDGKYLPSAQFKTCWGGMTCYSGHNGIDYPMPIGTPLVAAASGKVILRYDYEGGLIIDHGNGYRTVYWHMDKIIVNLNQAVNAGQQIGWSGNRGQSTGPHLHFVLRISALSRDIDPYGWWAVQKDPWPYPSNFMWRGDLTVDNRDGACQLFYGGYWTRDAAGYGGESWYTLSGRTFGASTNWGIWGTYIDRPGSYQVYAFWPKSPENTTGATYQVWHAGGPSNITVSQRDDGSRWVLLGTFDFKQGQAAVILTDLTKDNPPKQRVYFDAIRWEPVEKSYYLPEIIRN